MASSSYSHNQLLKTMFEFELRNNLDLQLAQAGKNYEETKNLQIAKDYITGRIKQLS